MVYREIISAEAEQDILNIVLQSTDTKDVDRFLNNLQSIIEILKKHPAAFAPRYKDVRVVLFKKLPFKLVYQIINPDVIYILAVFHHKQDEGRWIDRV